MIFSKQKTGRNHFRFSLKHSILITLAFLGLIKAYSQPANYYSNESCHVVDGSFNGAQEETLCEELETMIWFTPIGEGTSIVNSSQLGQNQTQLLTIVGDFLVNTNLNLQSSVVKIEPGVQISITSQSTLTLDGCRLYSCGDLWKGIVLQDAANIKTLNETEIEDAEIAIQAKDVENCKLEIENTTFNRNRIGISIENEIASANDPILTIFRNNIFDCSAPLNGTDDEITEYGIEFKNINGGLFNGINNANNEFRRIKNGIYAIGPSVDLNINNYTFKAIRGAGIEFRGGELKVDNSIFDIILKQGIIINNGEVQQGQQVDITNSSFYVRNLDPYSLNNPVEMIFFLNQWPGNRIHIGTGNYFYTEGLLNETVSCVWINNGDLSSVNASIHDSTFDLYNFAPVQSHPQSGLTNGSRAIRIVSNAMAGSDIDVSFNTINTNDLDSHISTNLGISVGAGIKNGLTIQGNNFTGNGGSIRLSGSDGIGNVVIDNIINSPQQLGGGGISCFSFQNLNMCSNEIHAGTWVSYLLNGANNNMIFSNNTTYGGGQQSLWIAGTTPVIGQQFIANNEWYPGIFLDGNGSSIVHFPIVQHNDIDEALINLSKFFVQTPQSVFNDVTNSYDYFSRFHPANVIPDVFPYQDIFFEESNGSPGPSCAFQLQSPPDLGDIAIADDSYASLMSTEALAWEGKRHLYQKLKKIPEYQSKYSEFSNFLINNSSSPIGKFYDVLEALVESGEISAALESQISQKNIEIAISNTSISSILGQSNLDEVTLSNELENRYNLVMDKLSLLESANDDQLNSLQTANTILNSIVTSYPFEENRKIILGHYIQSHLNQGGEFTESQFEDIMEIAKSCSETAGMVVYIAQGLLKKCDLESIQDEIELCHPQNIPSEDRRIQSESIESEGEILVRPNPTNGNLNVFNSSNSNSELKLYSILGQLITSFNLGTGNNNLFLDIESGIYILEITFENGKKHTEQLVVE